MIILNEKEVKFGQFPNGESNLNYNQLILKKSNDVTLKFESDADLFNLYILKSFLDTHTSKVRLTILYMPYSRMDRLNNYYTFNLKFVAKFINDMKFKSVTVVDAHSDVTTALIDRVDPISYTATLFGKFQKEVKEFVVMFPDAGAEKRYSKTFCYPTVVGSKERDFSNGEIIKFNISGADVTGKDVVIIDDLCSKGGTFVGAAKALKEAGANKVYLIVTHCENTIFQGELFDHIEKVYTTNSILNDTTGGINVQMNVTHLYTLKSSGY
jgi:ribose-phosphate pyrophosphokinase